MEACTFDRVDSFGDAEKLARDHAVAHDLLGSTKWASMDR
jgi:hypothetical protein